MIDETLKRRLSELGISEEAFNNEGTITVLYEGRDADGTLFHAYLEMNTGQFMAFDARVQAKEPIDLREYTILHMGGGRKPSKKVRKEMETKHGVNHQYEEEVKKELKVLSEEYQHLKKYNVSDEQYIRQKAKELIDEYLK